MPNKNKKQTQFNKAFDHFCNFINSSNKSEAVEYWSDYLNNKSNDKQADKADLLSFDFDNLRSNIDFNNDIKQADKEFLIDYVTYIQDLVNL